MFSLLPWKPAAHLRRWRWTPWNPARARRARSLRLLESVSLGERRFVALIEAQGQRLLIGTTPQSMTLLSDFGDTRVRETFEGTHGGPVIPMGVN